MKKQLKMALNYFKTRISKKMKISIFGIAFFAFMFTPGDNVYAIPTYARQTGLACSACHTVFPQLTSFGRLFKLNGYTLTGIKTVEQKSSVNKDETLLRILSIAPVSAMFQSGITSLSKDMPGTNNGNVEFPQQLSLFYGGQITPKMGSFIQLTLADDSGTFGLDNTEIRYANTTKGKTPVTYGFFVNNNPTMQDLWNSTPAWGYPYTSSGVAPTPGAGALIDDMGGAVAGLGGYAMINNAFYLELTGYKTAQLGGALPPDATTQGALNGTAPYWRLAYQKQWKKSYLELGTYGMSTKIYPTGVSGATDNFADFAFDMQYEYQFEKGQFTLHSSYTAENQTLNSSFASGDSQNLKNHLNEFKVNGSLFFNKGFMLTTGYFNTVGSADNGLYAPNQVDGSNNAKPNSNGVLTQFDFLPWENTKFSVQYFAYGKFNGASSNYDGFGRNASDNNMLYLQLWIAF